MYYYYIEDSHVFNVIIIISVVLICVFLIFVH